MIGVDLIGDIRRAYFEEHLPIKEIVRCLSVSGATVRKVVRGEVTWFKYDRGAGRRRAGGQPYCMLDSSNRHFKRLNHPRWYALP